MKETQIDRMYVKLGNLAEYELCVINDMLNRVSWGGKLLKKHEQYSGETADDLSALVTFYNSCMRINNHKDIKNLYHNYICELTPSHIYNLIQDLYNLKY